MMRSRALRHRLHLQRATVTRGRMNAPTEAWATLATVSAERVLPRVAERLSADQVAGTTRILFRIRWAPAWADLGPRDRLLELGSNRVWRIEGAEQPSQIEGVPTPPNRFIDITAVARTDVRP